jgi:hypothetical protein
MQLRDMERVLESSFCKGGPLSSMDSQRTKAHSLFTVASGQINPDWDCLQANYMLSSFKADNLICP